MSLFCILRVQKLVKWLKIIFYLKFGRRDLIKTSNNILQKIAFDLIFYLVSFFTCFVQVASFKFKVKNDFKPFLPIFGPLKCKKGLFLGIWIIDLWSKLLLNASNIFMTYFEEKKSFLILLVFGKFGHFLIYL